jgi:predicted nucleotidyltransferase
MDPKAVEKISHLPHKTGETIVKFADRLVEALGENLISIMLFGSTAGGDYIEAKSDINVLIILQNARVIDLTIIMEAGKKFAKRGLSVPLIFEKDHISTSLDTFPIEFSDMISRHILLYGADPFEGAEIDRKNLRYQCERELKSIMVNLRRGFLRTDGKKENIQSLVEGSFSSVLAVCRGLVWLFGKQPSHDIGKLLEEIESSYKSDTSAVARVWHLRKGGESSTATLEVLLEDYIRDIANLAALVDKM